MNAETTNSPTTPAPLQHFIGGQWRPGTGAATTSFNPARPGEIVACGNQATTDDVDAAMAAAVAASPGWAHTPIQERGQVLLRAAAHIETNAQTWGLELAREEGKTLAEGVGEVNRAASILRYYSAEGDRLAGEIFSSPRRGERILVTRKPLGVVGVVTPFNFPIGIPAWKIAPALVYGNTVVWKPASTVPLLAVRLAEAFEAAGLPVGVLNLLIGPGALGNHLLEHPRLDGLTFTGSTGVGRALSAKAASLGVPIQAEMGGKNASIVLADADLELAVDQVLLGAFRSSGQKCTATSRLILVDSIAEIFLERLCARLDTWRIGDPTDPSVTMGPVVSDGAAEDIRTGVREAQAQGARLVYGGVDSPEHARQPLPAARSFLAPTVLEVPRTENALDNAAWRQEFFGPVLSFVRATSTDDAFALANDSEFGLSCALFTQDITAALEGMEVLDVGILHVNSESAGADPHVPFGGAKKSGYGPKEQGGAAKEFFTHTTTVYLRGGATA
ncbi:MAG: aldehyde dehydrogenase family protein [Specibacter sp.]